MTVLYPYIVAIHVNLCTYSVIILPSWKMVVLHVKYTGRYTYVYKHVARLYQPCRNHCLFTTLWPPCYNQKLARGCESGQPSGEVVTTLSQPCHNHATTLFQTCHNVVNKWYKDCCTTYLVTRLSQPSFFYMGFLELCTDLVKLCNWWRQYRILSKILDSKN